jgi:hypothetical protein
MRDYPRNPKSATPFPAGLRVVVSRPDPDEMSERLMYWGFMAKGAPFQEWKGNPFPALMMYIQLYEIRCNEAPRRRGR